VVAKAKRRTYTAEDKQRILEEAEAVAAKLVCLPLRVI
jgi:transposase-like protein